MKKKILVYWDYRRKDLLLPFEKLSADFEWYFVFFREPDEDPVRQSVHTVYWSDYRSPYELLKKIQPLAVIFSDTSSLYAVSLNIACKNKKIKTYLLEHGVKLNYSYYAKMENLTRFHYIEKNGHKKGNGWKKFHTLKFYFSALAIKNLGDFVNAARLFYKVFRTKSEKTYAENQFSLRCPDQYLLFSRQNFPYYAERDGISEKSVTYFGNPYQDDYIRVLFGPREVQEKPYYLLLDDGIVEVFGITVPQKNEFIKKLNDFALSNNAQLIVKLHPFDYGRTDLYRHENIIYKEAVDVSNLILHARGNFAISTTLMLPLVPKGKVIIFRVKESKIQEVLEDFGVHFLDFLHFHPDEIDFDQFKLKPEATKDFIDNFLYRIDGQSLQRLKSILEH